MHIDLNLFFKQQILAPIARRLNIQDKTVLYIASFTFMLLSATFLYFSYQKRGYLFGGTRLTKIEAKTLAALKTITTKIHALREKIAQLETLGDNIGMDLQKVLNEYEANAQSKLNKINPLIDKTDILKAAIKELNQLDVFCKSLLTDKEKEDFKVIQWLSDARKFIHTCPSTLSLSQSQDFERIIRSKPINVICLQYMEGTLLHLLADKGKPLQLIAILAKHKIDFNQRNRYGYSALMWAIIHSQNSMAMQLLRIGKQHTINLNMQDIRIAISPQTHTPRLNSALHLIIAKGSQVGHEESNISLLDELIEEGADLNLQNSDHNTPLHIAFLRRDVHAIKALFKAGAKQDIPNIEGLIPQDLLQLSYEAACQRLNATMPQKIQLSLLNKIEFEENLAAIQALLID
jgi:ankyrin repeat protein